MEPTGSISSPNYPGNYDNNIDCQWLITVAEKFVIEVEFRKFLLEYKYDYLKVL